MNNIDLMYEELGLSEPARERLVQLGRLAQCDLHPKPRVVVETYVVQNGATTLVAREEHGG